MLKTCFCTGLFVLLLVFARPVDAEPLTIDLAHHQVEITSGFTGTNLIVFGQKDEPGEVAIVIEGPHHDIVVRRKAKVFGAWVNREWLKFKDLPTYYDYALEGESEKGLLNADLLNEKRIGLSMLNVAPEEERYEKDKILEFQKALIRQKQEQEIYPSEPDDIQYLGKEFFRADFHLPANLPSGDYTVRAYLIRKGEVVYEQQKAFMVGLTGFNAAIFEFSKNAPFLYGLMCVLIACVAGWVSYALVRRS